MYFPLSDKSLLTVNCTASTPALVESELWVRRRAASTGVVTDKVGPFDKADTGTIVLDEIGAVLRNARQALARAGRWATS